ncbi:MAG: response regulator [Marinobacterium sp.]|nr:response regulator [Marinobacterium sp.]
MERIILVVDDEPSILKALQRVFRKDWKVLTATDIAHAMALLGQHDVSVVLSDYRMPGTDGIEFLNRVKSYFPCTRRYLLSGQADFEAVSASVSSGACHRFLAKPWRDDQLREHVENGWQQWCEQKQAEREGAAGSDVVALRQQFGELLTNRQLGLLFQYDPLAVSPVLHWCLASLKTDAKPLSLDGLPAVYYQQLTLWADCQLQTLLLWELGEEYSLVVAALTDKPNTEQRWLHWQAILPELPVALPPSRNDTPDSATDKELTFL